MVKNRKHIRLQNYTYASEGFYFVTICTGNRECFFWKIENDLMLLSDIGAQASLYWQDIPNHFPHVALGEFVIMPNHIHGIIEIVTNVHGVDSPKAVTCYGPTVPSTKERMARLSPPQGSLSVVVRLFKSMVTKWCNQNHHTYFAWQYRFHDHIIRSRKELETVENYIRNNVSDWNRDKFYRL